MANCTVTYSFSNGSTADANQVNKNFSDLFNCAAPLANPSFTGNVGIGTASPSQKLDVSGSANADNWYLDGSMTGSAGTIGFSNSNGPAIQFFGASASSTPGTTRFLTAGTEHARFGSDGSFLAGTTANGGWIGNATAEFFSPATQALSAYSISGNALVLRVDSTANNLAWLTYNGSGIGSIATNGSSVSFNTTSDERLKTVLTHQKDYRDVIEHLWVGDFEWKRDHSHSFGILAQQAYSVFPEAVYKPATDAGLWQADYGKFAPLAIWGVKDIYKVVEKQGDQLASLKAEVALLKSQIETMQRVNYHQALEVKRLTARSVTEVRRQAARNHAM